MCKWINKLNNRKAFTIVELVIVIAVIAILATVLVPTFGNVINNAKDSAAKQEARNAYTEYVVDAAASGAMGQYYVYQADEGRFVAIDSGAAVGVYESKEAALAAMIPGADLTKLNEIEDSDLFVYDVVPANPGGDGGNSGGDNEPGTPDEPESNVKKVDLVMFMGQSNMAGRGVAAQSVVVPEGHGYEFRAVSDPTKLYPVTEPFGVNENNSTSGVAETTKTGSMVSAFVAEYYTHRQVPIVAVSCSKGATSLDFWKPDGAALNDAIARHDAAKTWLEANGYTIENDFMVWCQGETDGGQNKSAAAYEAELTAIIEEMVAEAGIDFCAVVRIGNANGNAARHAEIIKAQTELCKSYDKAVLVSAKLAGFGADMMKDEYHYTQSAYNEVGKDAGKNTADYIKTGTEPSMYDPQYNNNYPEDDISIQVEFTFDSEIENDINLRTIGTLENGALTVTVETNSASENGITLAKPITISPNESFTIEFVSSYPKDQGNVIGTILGNGTTSGGFLYLGATPNAAVLRLRNATNTVEFNGSTTPTTADSKTHFAVVYNAGTGKIAMYQDYSIVEVTPVNASIDGFGSLTFTHFCGGYNADYRYRGVMYYFKYTDQALSVDAFHRE